VVERPQDRRRQRAHPARAHLGQRRDLCLAIRPGESAGLIAGEHRGKIVAETGAGQRRRDDLGQRRDRAVADLLLELAPGCGIEDRRHDRDIGIQVAYQQRGAQGPGVIARDDGDGIGPLRERVADLLRLRVFETDGHGPCRLERGVSLVGEIAGAEQENAPSRHADGI
jgi:hypothetical protein